MYRLSHTVAAPQFLWSPIFTKLIPNAKSDPTHFLFFSFLFKFKVLKCSLSGALSLKNVCPFGCCRKKYVGREIITQGSFKFNNYNKFKIHIKITLNDVLDFKQNTYIIYCLPWRAARLILQNNPFGQYKFQTSAIHYGPRFCGHILYIKPITVFLVLLFSGQRTGHANNSVS